MALHPTHFLKYLILGNKNLIGHVGIEAYDVMMSACM